MDISFYKVCFVYFFMVDYEMYENIALIAIGGVAGYVICSFRNMMLKSDSSIRDRIDSMLRQSTCGVEEKVEE